MDGMDEVDDLDEMDVGVTVLRFLLANRPAAGIE